MPIPAGAILISHPLLEDTNFYQAVVLITSSNEKGAMGFVTNRLFPRPLNQLEEFKQGIAFPIHDGGPMDREHLFFVHQCPGVIDGGEYIRENLYLGGNFKKAVTAINHPTIGQQDIKIFIGYCGWDYGELEAEVAEGSWIQLTDPGKSIVFEDNPNLWKKLYETQGQAGSKNS